MTDLAAGGMLDLATTAIGYNFMSPEVKAAMKVSLQVLQIEYGFKQMFLWGKLKGMSGDYIIAQGISYSLNESDKTFFYCLDGTSWAQMAQTDDGVMDVCSKIPWSVALTGDAAFQYTVTKELPEGEDAQENEEELSATVTEDVRIACMVKEIDAAIAMIPVGAVAVDPKLGVPVQTSTFTGLTKEESMQLSSWELLSGTSCAHQLIGSLKAKFLASQGLTVLRSLLWPGFAAYTVPGTGTYGYMYVGDGHKNHDIAFSLP